MSNPISSGWANSNENNGPSSTISMLDRSDFGDQENSKPRYADDLQRQKEFSSLREVLLGEQHAEKLQRELAYWAVASDRGLPFALLRYKVGELINSQYDKLALTMGVGPKKLDCLLMLLRRVVNDEFGQLVAQENESDDKGEPVASAEFDPSSVTESQWCQWCELVSKYKLGSIKLGQLASSLREIPSVVWNEPLGAYTQYTLAEIRKLKTYGEKRVGAVLTVFDTVRRILQTFDSEQIVPSRLLPKNILRIESWIDSVVADARAFDLVDLRKNLAEPLLDQIRIDSNPTHAKLIQSQVNIGAEKRSVKQLAREFGLTRARVYQVFEDCKDIFIVRWPDSKVYLDHLSSHFEDQSCHRECFDMMQRIQEWIE